MQKIKDAASVFLANKRVAVTGPSRHAKDHGSNVVHKRLRDRSYEVYAVNPNADEVEGDRCYQPALDPRRRRRGGDRNPNPRPPKPRCTSVPSSASNTYGCTVAPGLGASRTRQPITAGSRELP